MIFGKIEYLNLLPFHVFMKRFTRSSQERMSMQYYKNVPSAINTRFIARKVDAAFISSIAAKKYANVGLGIIAKKEVLSVLLVPQEEYEKDSASASSNALAKVLGLEGKVMIGDRALSYFFDGGEHIDLAQEWNTRYGLPFVFALLCFHKEEKLYKKIEQKFLKAPVKIPQYLLQKASKETGISPKNILYYLDYISYNFDASAKRGLKLFYRLSSVSS